MSETSNGAAGTSRAWPTRRLILAGLAASTILYGVISFAVNSPEALVMKRIRRLFPNIEMLESELRQFADDFTAHDMQSGQIRMIGLRVAAPLLYSPAFHWMMPGKARDLLTSFDRRIVTAFLMSTDFLEARAAESRRVTYNAYFEPYTKVCGNPLPYLSRKA